MRKSKWLTMVALVGVLTLVAAACSKDNGGGGGGTGFDGRATCVNRPCSSTRSRRASPSSTR